MLVPFDKTVTLLPYFDVPGAYIAIHGRWANWKVKENVATTVTPIYVNGAVAVQYVPTHNRVEIIRDSDTRTGAHHWLFGDVQNPSYEDTANAGHINQLFISGDFKSLFEYLKDFGRL